MNEAFQPAIAIIAFPLLGFLIQAFLGKWLIKRMGTRLVGTLGVLPIVLSFVVTLLLTYRLAELPERVRSQFGEYFDWISLQSFSAPFELIVDPLSMTMALIITGVGSLIHIYSTAYMSGERDYSRFFCYMNLFVAAMLLLVLGNNLVLLFVGWEGVGLCSYLLIGFWYKDLANARAANKAFIVNRIGDWGLMIALFLIVAVLPAAFQRAGGRALSYDVFTGSLMNILRENPALATTIALLLFVGAAGKSAQFPLYVWLPDAMAGPTPVSALIHAATMVTSGVFLMNRMSFVFALSPVASAVVCVIGAFTAAFAAVIAFGQTDIKRVLAYSTVSQLGFMFIACGAGAYWAGMFHVTTHAFFKALLFLGAGAVIYAMAHNQDMRNYGRLMKYMPITGACMIVGWLAIAGFPGLSGFFSKEAILGSALASDHAAVDGIRWAAIAGWVGLGVAFLTALYMTRLTMLTFFGNKEQWREIPADTHPHGQEAHATAEENPALAQTILPGGFFYSDEELSSLVTAEEHHHELNAEHTPKEAPISMTGVLILLAIASAVGGFLLSGKFEQWLYPMGTPVLREVSHEPHGIPLMALSIAAAVLGIAAGIGMYLKGLPADQGFDENKWQKWRRGAREQFGFDYVTTTAAIEGGGEVGRGIWRFFDVGLLDRIVNGVGIAAVSAGGVLKTIQTGYVRLYALIMLIGGVAFVSYFVYVISTMGGAR